MMASPRSKATATVNRQKITTNKILLRLLAAIRSRKVVGSMAVRVAANQSRLEFYLGCLADGGGFGSIELEELRLAEAKHARQNVGGKTHERRVVLADHIIVVLSRETDAVL